MGHVNIGLQAIWLQKLPCIPLTVASNSSSWSSFLGNPSTRNLLLPLAIIAFVSSSAERGGDGRCKQEILVPTDLGIYVCEHSM